jgi:hypothetical protein
MSVFDKTAIIFEFKFSCISSDCTQKGTNTNPVSVPLKAQKEPTTKMINTKILFRKLKVR